MWVEENIMTEELLVHLLQRYRSRDPNQLLLIFAILLSGIGFLIFIFSDWAQQPYFSRIFIVLLVMTVLYIVGDYLYRNQSQAFGISFITLGFIVFGSGLFLALNNFNVLVTNPWPFIVWSIVGLLLFFVYNHPFLFVLSIVVTTVGQLYSGIVFSLFCWILFLVLLLGDWKCVVLGYIFFLEDVGLLILRFNYILVKDYAYDYIDIVVITIY